LSDARVAAEETNKLLDASVAAEKQTNCSMQVLQQEQQTAGETDNESSHAGLTAQLGTKNKVQLLRS
jgi:hypothetical protein